MERARFIPGQTIAERYRIVGLIGRGGMGEVYRAEDLKLRQPVALKFLPEEVGQHPARLETILHEVRTAREVSHPNVCRVHDVTETDGMHFISMEFVDGEDLASLMARVGRLPLARATAIAREVCAGLAAIHDRGLVHRDVKPANIMVDGSGHARITDFGLAERQGAGGDAGVIVGTPAYLAPECMGDGVPPTIQSDLYSLGLVMYELFTGRRAFEADNLVELIHRRRNTKPVAPSRHERGLDLLIERLIVRCLETDPALRPDSARTVAAIFPGGDPLATAIAAGETPSPELVAAGEGGREGWHPATVWGGFAALVAGLALVVAFAPQTRLVTALTFPDTPEAMAARARRALAAAGAPTQPVDRALGYRFHPEVIERIAATDRARDRWQDLARRHPDIVSFWYRESPVALEPSERRHRIGLDDPPYRPGMAGIEFDMAGRPMRITGAEGPPPRAESDPPVTGMTIPPGEAAPAARDTIARMIEFASGSLRAPLLLVAMLIGAWLARRNLRAGRGDMKRALRVAAALFLNRIAIWLLGGHHTAATLTDQTMAAIAWGLYDAAYGCIVYLAIEPYVRQLWPRVLISWVRLLDGRIGDARVGRDLLAGCAIGTAIALLVAAHQAAPLLFGAPPGRPDNVGYVEHQLTALLGLRHQIADQLWLLRSNLTLVMGFVVILVVTRLLVRNAAAAVVLSFLIFVPLALPRGEFVTLDLALGATSTALLLFAMLRFGLLAATIGLVTHTVLQSIALRIGPSWTGTNTLLVLALLLAVGGYGAARATGAGVRRRAGAAGI